MSSSERRSYENIFQNSDEFVTDYAKTSVVEAYAESAEFAFSCSLDIAALPENRQEFFDNNWS